MPTSLRRTTSLAVTLTMLLVINACGTTPPSSFYLLEPIDGSTFDRPIAAAHDVHIGVGPIQFAEYLDRTQIVTRTDRTQVHLAETHRWAEPLQHNFTRIVADNLSALLNTDRVSIHPSRNWSDIDYQVLISVWQLDASTQGDVTLVANWSIRADDGTKLLTMKKSVFNTRIEPAASYADIADAMSKTIGMLSREIADAISSQAHEQVSN